MTSWLISKASVKVFWRSLVYQKHRSHENGQILSFQREKSEETNLRISLTRIRKNKVKNNVKYQNICQSILFLSCEKRNTTFFITLQVSRLMRCKTKLTAFTTSIKREVCEKKYCQRKHHISQILCMYEFTMNFIISRQKVIEKKSNLLL